MSGGRILIVDDHPATREGLSLAARAALPGATIVMAGTIADAVSALRARAPFRQILLDFDLPDAHGYSGLLKLQHLAPAVQIIMVTAREEPTLIEAAKALGASGYLLKRSSLDQIAAALRDIIAGAVRFPESSGDATGIAAAHARISDLSRAQYAVLMALADGRSNKQIARDLHVTEATVKAHMSAILRKLGVGNRAQVLIAMQPLFQAQ